MVDDITIVVAFLNVGNKEETPANVQQWINDCWTRVENKDQLNNVWSELSMEKWALPSLGLYWANGEGELDETVGNNENKIK